MNNTFMNYAFMSFSCPQATFAEMLALAAQYGYAGIEPRAGGNHNHAVELDASAQQRASFRQQAAEAGIAICCLAAGNRFADPASGRPRWRNHFSTSTWPPSWARRRCASSGDRYPPT